MVKLIMLFLIEIFVLQVSNEDAISFYLKRGYRVVKEVKDYYKRIIPPHAYLMEKDVEG